MGMCFTVTVSENETVLQDFPFGLHVLVFAASMLQTFGSDPLDSDSLFFSGLQLF